MIEERLTEVIGIPREEVERLLAMPAIAIYRDEAFRALVNRLDKELLFSTLPDTRAAFDFHIPIFQARVRTAHPQVAVQRMSASTLGMWLVGFLQIPNAMERLAVFHAPVPPDFIREFLPDLLAMLDDIAVGRQEWQRALALLSLPLLATQRA